MSFMPVDLFIYLSIYLFIDIISSKSMHICQYDIVILYCCFPLMIYIYAFSPQWWCYLSFQGKGLYTNWDLIILQRTVIGEGHLGHQIKFI